MLFVSCNVPATFARSYSRSAHWGETRASRKVPTLSPLGGGWGGQLMIVGQMAFDPPLNNKAECNIFLCECLRECY